MIQCTVAAGANGGRTLAATRNKALRIDKAQLDLVVVRSVVDHCASNVGADWWERCVARHRRDLGQADRSRDAADLNEYAKGLPADNVALDEAADR